MDIRRLLAVVRASWQWTAERYPHLDLTDPTAPRHHVLLHLMKAAAGLASCQERHAHGHGFNHGDHRFYALKLLLSAVQTVALENMSEDEICRELGQAAETARTHRHYGPGIPEADDPFAARRHSLDRVMQTLGGMAGHHIRYRRGDPFGSEEHRQASIALLAEAMHMIGLEELHDDDVCAGVEAILASANG